MNKSILEILEQMRQGTEYLSHEDVFHPCNSCVTGWVNVNYLGPSDFCYDACEKFKTYWEENKP